MALSNGLATLPGDMAPCPADSHSGFDLDFVRKGTRGSVIQALDEPTAYEHGPSGYPSFSNWPNALSVDHQQMHVLMVRRAYEGGLRLMVASVADNQMLSNLWHMGFNVFGNSIPKPDSNLEYESAVRQLTFIRQMALANPTWMQVVTSAAECKDAVSHNKLAIVLSLEMDSLTPAQILSLVHTFGVREVIPIHLSNNSFGGTAAYSDLFNTNTQFLTGSFIQVRNDPLLSFRFSKPQTLQAWPFLGVVAPGSVSDPIFNALGYAKPGGGHRNIEGLNRPELVELMRAGVIIDVAHMSENATEAAISLAEGYHYPLLDSHTGMRGPDETAVSERDLRHDHAVRIGALGGMMGLGTTGDSANVPLLSRAGSPVVRFTGDTHNFTAPLSATGPHANDVAYRAAVTLVTGGDDLRGGGNSGDNANLIVTLANGKTVQLTNINKGQTWGNNTAHMMILPLPGGTRISDLRKVEIATHFGGGFNGDNWNVDNVMVTAVSQKQDMVQSFIEDYNLASVVFHGRVGLGTDFNGFSPQLPFATQEVAYPFTPPLAPVGTAELSASKLGSKTYSFQRDGLAHYGMLADFMKAVSQRSNSASTVSDLFSSANSFYEMWLAVEKAAPTVH